MGDRGNIVIQEAPGKRVYLYTHWSGSEITDIAKKALKRKQRWDDASYLARIVFSEMLQHNGDLAHTIKADTGFGIGTTIGDNSHPVLVLAVDTQWVWYEDENGTVNANRRMTFDEFIS